VTPGTRLGPYEILEPIGAGGMGEVFKGRDTRLDRSVAIKILPPEFAQNAQLKLRFDREAKIISQLEHPHICRLYDVGEATISETPAVTGMPVEAGPPLSYLVMELLEGESLADRLMRGPLAVGDVLKYGVQISEALDRAHRQGIVHRDLKPGNVMLTKAGAKLLDFGLAKSAAGALVGSTTSLDGATEHKPLTEQGAIVGTFQYMAPEQIEGMEADARTDIFALGAVLYEMATGKRAFEGKTKTSLIAAIVTVEPKPITDILPLAPPALEHIIRKCLSKDPEERWQSAHDIAEELRWIQESGSQAGVATTIAVRRVHRERLAWTAAAVAGALGMVAAIGYVRRAPRQEPASRFVIAAPPQTSLNPFDELGMELSPDGRRVAFVAISSDGRRQLWVRPFSDFDARALPETFDASYPFWSPDSRSIAFFAGGKLRKIDAAGGPPQVICDAPSGRGGSWGKDGTILFAPNVYSAIHAVPASGGVAKAITQLHSATEVTHRWPHFLPDGKNFLYVVRPKGSGGSRGPGRLMIASLDSGAAKLLMEEATNTVYTNGHLLFGRDQRLMAQPFDLEEQKLTGDAFVVVGEKLSYWEPKNLVVFSATPAGALVYLPETPPLADLRLFSRDGKQLESIAGDSLLGYGARFSPDGSRIAYSLGDRTTGRGDVWLYDVTRKRSTRFTFQPGSYWSMAWAPDASRLYFASSPQSIGNVYQKPLKGSAAIQPLIETGFWQLGVNVSPDGRTLAFSQQSGEARYDLWLLRLGGKPEIFLRTPFDEIDPNFSPDGRWIAYTSQESGRSEVYVRPAEGTPDQWQVSAAGGLAPRWRRDGREIIYISPDGKLHAVPVQTAASFEAGEPKELFSAGPAGDAYFTALQDISPDGQQLLLMSPSSVSAPSMRAVIHWRIAPGSEAGR